MQPSSISWRAFVGWTCSFIAIPGLLILQEWPFALFAIATEAQKCASAPCSSLDSLSRVGTNCNV